MIVAAAVQSYLHEHIPLSRQMQVRVERCTSDGVELSAPLAPNINHQGTVFGGSASALAMLAGWAFVHARVAELPFETRLVIRRNSMDFDAPIDGDCRALCIPEPDSLEAFDRQLRDDGKGRIELQVDVQRGEQRCARFVGVYVALRA